MIFEKDKKLVITNVTNRFEQESRAISNFNQGLLERFDSLFEDNSEECDSVKDKVFLLEIKADIIASSTELVAKAVSAILNTATSRDQVVIKLESGGGSVNGYGLLSYEINRLKQRNIHTTIAVDRIAASGGYMAACQADLLIAAPLAYIGSIGVVSETPNINNLLNKNGVCIEQHTAGENKRDLTFLGKNTDDARKHHREKLEQIHEQFISHVKNNRRIPEESQLFRAIFSGDFWTAKETIDKGFNLVDKIMSSEELLYSLSKDNEILQISFKDRGRTGMFSSRKVALDSLVKTGLSHIEKRIFELGINTKGVF